MNAYRASRVMMWMFFLSGLVIVAAVLGIYLLPAGWKWPHEPFHSTIESFGAVVAIMLGIFTAVIHRSREGCAYSIWISCGLAAMGILDVFHASAHPGAAFVWFRSLSTLTGGFLFAMVWLAPATSKPVGGEFWISGSMLGAAILGVFFLVMPAAIPEMITSQGEFSSLAQILNAVGAFLFLAAVVALVSRFQRDGDSNKLLFACLALLFAVAGMMFGFSHAWEGNWWMWHILRLTAYVFALSYLVLMLYQRYSGSTNEAVMILTSTAEEMSVTVSQHERVVEQQAAAVSETTATAEELGISAQTTAKQAETTAISARASLAVMERGVQLVRQVDESIGGMKEVSGAVASQILRLSEQVEQIRSISKVVGELASETNMLALNAAVEAARAGEHGKGFAVVASEVRKLANQSKKSAQRADALMSEIQKITSSTVMLTEQSNKTLDEVAAISRQTGEAFGSLSQIAQEVYQNSQQVMLNSKQQAGGLSQVAEAMKNLKSGAQDIAAGSRQTKIGAQKLNELAQSLKTML